MQQQSYNSSVHTDTDENHPTLTLVLKSLVLKSFLATKMFAPTISP